MAELFDWVPLVKPVTCTTCRVAVKTPHSVGWRWDSFRAARPGYAVRWTALTCPDCEPIYRPDDGSNFNPLN